MKELTVPVLLHRRTGGLILTAALTDGGLALKKRVDLMRRVIVLSICGLALSACTSGSFPSFESKPTPATLRLESVPPGAEAKLATGEACKTPCALPVTGGDLKELTVTYTLEGYKPEAIEVAIAQPLSAAEPVHLDPNPVTVELEKAPMVVKKRRVVVRKPVAGKPVTVVRKPVTVVRKPAAVVRKPAATVTKKKTVTVVKKPARKPVVRRKPAPKPAAAPPAATQPAPAAPAPASSGSAPSPWGPPPQIPGSAPTTPPQH